MDKTLLKDTTNTNITTDITFSISQYFSNLKIGVVWHLSPPTMTPAGANFHAATGERSEQSGRGVLKM